MAIIDPATGRSELAHRLMLSVQEWTCQEPILHAILQSAEESGRKRGLSESEIDQLITDTANGIKMLATRIRQSFEDKKLTKQGAADLLRAGKVVPKKGGKPKVQELSEFEIRQNALAILLPKISRHAVIRYVAQTYQVNLRLAARQVCELARSVYHDLKEMPNMKVSLVSKEMRAD